MERPSNAQCLALLVWLFAGAAMFLPFASDTSPWDAMTLRVPGNQGNWWHFLVGLPFLLAIPMGLGTVIASGALLFVCYRGMSATRACLGALNTAYLGNAALCLIVYSPGIGHIRANPGWPVTLGVVCFIVPEQIWIFVRSRAVYANLD
jgi:hypothetical protein